MGLKVLKIKGLGKISVIYASFCAPYNHAILQISIYKWFAYHQCTRVKSCK